jgi:hypothetical protein
VDGTARNAEVQPLAGAQVAAWVNAAAHQVGVFLLCCASSSCWAASSCRLHAVADQASILLRVSPMHIWLLYPSTVFACRMRTAGVCLSYAHSRCLPVVCAQQGLSHIKVSHRCCALLCSALHCALYFRHCRVVRPVPAARPSPEVPTKKLDHFHPIGRTHAAGPPTCHPLQQRQHNWTQREEHQSQHP